MTRSSNYQGYRRLGIIGKVRHLKHCIDHMGNMQAEGIDRKAIQGHLDCILELVPEIKDRYYIRVRDRKLI